MGQYRQWLYHREVDQQLRAKLATLEQELRSVQEHVALVEDAASWIDNPIIQAIAMQQSSEALLAAATPAPDPYSMPPASFAYPTSSEQPTQTVSPALFAWSHLPNLDTEEIRLQDALAGTDEEPQPMLHSLAEANLLPEDIASFIETHTQAIPQLSTSPNITAANPITAALESKTAPDDRTDRSIERWIARWRPKPPATSHQTHNQQQLQEETGA